jgi:hypothetical protein
MVSSGFLGGRTAALRLLVQPCDEADDDDDYFLSFS